jgi:hypothetical protein
MSRFVRSRCLAVLPFLLPLTIIGCASSGGVTAHAIADLAITGVHVVDVAQGRVLRDRVVLVTDGTIDRILPASPPPAVSAAATLDGAGGYLIPGLWDMHAHLRADGLPGWLITDWMMPLQIAHGVIGVRDMASDCDEPSKGPICLEQMREWQRQIDEGDLLGPRLLALSSWMVNPPWGYEMPREQAAQVVEMFAGQGVDMIKIYDRLAPEAFGWIMEEADRVGLRVGGHVPLRLTAAAAAEAGFWSIEHARDFLFDCFPGSEEFRRTTQSKDPSIEVMRSMVEDHDPARCRETFGSLVENQTWYVPTHVTRRMEAYADDARFRDDPRNRYLPPPMLQAWNADADRMVEMAPTPEERAVVRAFYRKGLELTGAAHRAGVRVLLGTDGGDSFVYPGSGVHDELGELVAAGLTPAEALRAATAEAAEFLGRSDLHGTVEPGKRADLVLLAGDPLDSVENVREIRAVVFRGAVLDRERLDALLSQAESTAKRPLGPDAGE